MRFADESFWQRRIGPFPLFDGSLDLTAEDDQIEFWRMKRRQQYRAQQRVWYRRAKRYRTAYREKLNTNWGIF